MYRPAPRHPLHSFKFWFLVLACVATTTVWRMGWFPTTRETPETGLVEVDLSADDRSSIMSAELPESAPQGQIEPPYFPPPQAESAPALDPWAQSRMLEQLTGQPSAPPAPADHLSQTPFGPRDLEFVPADTFARTPQAADVPASVPPVQEIVQVAGVEEQAASPITDPARQVQNAFTAEVEQTLAADVDWDAIDRMINAGEDVEAHRLLSSLYWDRPELRAKTLPRVRQTALRIYFQPQPHYMDPYGVQPGDVLESIAKQYGVTWQYLAKLNRTDPRRIRPGQQLKVVPGPFGAVVDLRRFEMTVHANGWFVAHFPIGIGKDGSTPVGEFTVLDKLEDPTYYGPDRVIAHDDPENPLGEFWMSLGNGYGIHGTIDESTIGRAESRGCIRLRNQDVADAYDLLSVGSTVVIRR